MSLSLLTSRGLVPVLILIGLLPHTAAAEFHRGINLAGPAYTAVDGTTFAAEAHAEGGRVVHIDRVKGVQNQALFRDCRVGDVTVAMPLPDGTYDVAFYFAEPDEVEGGERLFDVLAEERPVIEDLDIMLFRDGKIRSGLTVVAPDVVVEDGVLDIDFEAARMEPLLCAVLVRDKRPRAASWQLAWQDEFDGEGQPDAGTWNFEEWERGRVNDEDQAYTRRPENVRLEDGVLVIEAHREDYGDARYTSARIQSKGKADFLYGRFEARARVPEGQGTWPAIWMLPSDPFTYATTCGDDSEWHGNNACDAWPNSGEIDILEHVGYQMGHVHGTVHTKAYYWAMWEQRKGRVLIDDVDSRFHVYALEWSPEKIDIFVDDTLYFTYVNEGTGWEAWPFDQPFHWILNLAVGGAWGRAGGPIDDSIFPQRLEVDWVRVYERPDIAAD
ncbi:MAG: family 16 glycosylhydrolase [Woeseiaceae bacterium]|jgi:beta-glucanase (GH16 family)|nr:family 16 glycosylhydrolase [Woeseiaceae bacterium]